MVGLGTRFHIFGVYRFLCPGFYPFTVHFTQTEYFMLSLASGHPQRVWGSQAGPKVVLGTLSGRCGGKGNDFSQLPSHLIKWGLVQRRSGLFQGI